MTCSTCQILSSVCQSPRFCHPSIYLAFSIGNANELDNHWLVSRWTTQDKNTWISCWKKRGRRVFVESGIDTLCSVNIRLPIISSTYRNPSIIQSWNDTRSLSNQLSKMNGPQTLTTVFSNSIIRVKSKRTMFHFNLIWIVTLVLCVHSSWSKSLEQILSQVIDLSNCDVEFSFQIIGSSLMFKALIRDVVGHLKQPVRFIEVEEALKTRWIPITEPKKYLKNI